MKTPQKRIAVIAIVVLLLGAGAWWWNRTHVEPSHSTNEPVMASPSELPMAMPRPVRAPLSGMSAGDPSDACGIAIHEAFNVRARGLALREDANSQLAYAMTVPLDPPVDLDRMGQAEVQNFLEAREAKTQRAFLHAAKLAPTRPDVLFLASAQCGNGKSCRSVRQALLDADGDNQAVWFLEMGRASVHDDPDAYERAFERAAKATRNDSYADSALQVLVEAYGDMPMPPACSSEQAKAAMRRETGMEHDFSMLDHALVLANASRAGSLPSYNHIRLRCMPHMNVTMGAETRAGCRNILTLMTDGDTLIERAIGLGTMVSLTAEEPDASAWRERYREFHWMYAQLGDSQVQRLLQPEDYWLDEVRATQAALEVLGRWPPPADWLPDDEQSRSLIQTGRPPPPKAR